MCMIQRNGKENGNNETLKPLESFTLDQIRKIASKLGYQRQKTKSEYIKVMTENIGKKIQAIINNSTERKEQQTRIRYINSIIVARIIGIVFHATYSSIYANLNDTE